MGVDSEIAVQTSSQELSMALALRRSEGGFRLTKAQVYDSGAKQLCVRVVVPLSIALVSVLIARPL